MTFNETDSIIQLKDDEGTIVKEIDILNDHIESDSVKLAFVVALTEKAMDMFEIALRCYRSISTSDQNKTALFQNRLKETRQKIIDALNQEKSIIPDPTEKQ